jgi:exosome complex exonuclease DIS3/RRP44
VRRFVAEVCVNHPQLLDLVAQHDGAEEEEEESAQGSRSSVRSGSQRTKSTRTHVFPAHLPLSELTVGIKAGKYFQGTLRCKRGHRSDCYVVVGGIVGGEEADERISVAVTGPTHLNRAIEGDIVAIEILPDTEGSTGGGEGEEAGPHEPSGNNSDKEQEDAAGSDDGAAVAEPTAPPVPGDLENVKRVAASPVGRVVGVIQRNWRHYCGSLIVGADEVSIRGSQATSVLVEPVDRRIPRIRIQTRQRDVLIGKRIVVAIDSWPTTSRYPCGHYVSTLGDSGDKMIETQVLLHEHNIPTDDFSGEVIACLPPEGWSITEENSRGRRDLRHLPVMSIDPPGCRDIDDALHWRALPNGNWEVGIHIADVTYFMPPGTPLDLEAANRSTSTYLVDRRLDMLPKMLTEKLCSLVGNQDRFAFTVLLEVTPNAQIIDADFCKSIIHSIGAHTYGEAQTMLDDPTRSDVKAESVRHLNHLAKLFRKRRMDAGALTLASPEVRFVLDTETQNPMDVQMYALKETNALVEEFMLLANITVGKKILRHFPTLSLLRRHPAPSKSQFTPLVSAAKAVGVDVHIEDSKRLADSLDNAVRPDDPYFNKLLRIVCTRCMAPAQYFSSGEQLQEEWHHYGLATHIYTHFTSPIRRYADVVVHRLLSAAIGVSPLPAQFHNKSGMNDLAENMNRRHRSAQLAGRASVSLHTQLYFRANPASEKAYIIAVHRDKLMVLVPRFGIEGTVWLTKEQDSGLVEYDAEAHRLTCEGQTVQVFDAVTVAISVEEDSGRANVKVHMTTPPLGAQPSAAELETDEEQPTIPHKKRGGASESSQKKTSTSGGARKKTKHDDASE